MSLRRFKPGDVWRDVYMQDDPVVFLVASVREHYGGWCAECLAIEEAWNTSGGIRTERTFWDNTHSTEFAEPIAVEDSRLTPL